MCEAVWAVRLPPGLAHLHGLPGGADRRQPCPGHVKKVEPELELSSRIIVVGLPARVDAYNGLQACIAGAEDASASRVRFLAVEMTMAVCLRGWAGPKGSVSECSR